jgi:heme exporter protein C
LKTLLAWILWLWIALVIVGALWWAPPLPGFQAGPDSSRIVYFHVPMAWTSFVAFLAAGVFSALYLKRREPRRDAAATAAVQLGLAFGLLALVSGMIWAKIEWGEFWNFDPRQTTIVLALLFYTAYLVLRLAVADHETRRRLAAGYAVFGLVVAPFLFFVAPRVLGASLHPEPVINAERELKMDPAVLWVLLSGSAAFTALFFWMHSLQCRLAAIARRNGLEA